MIVSNGNCIFMSAAGVTNRQKIGCGDPEALGDSMKVNDANYQIKLQQNQALRYLLNQGVF